MARAWNNSTSNYLNIGDVTAVDITGNLLSISAWIRPDLLNSTNHEIVGKWSSAARQYTLRVDSNNSLTFAIGGGGGTNSGISGTLGALKLNQWQHAGGSCDATDSRVYLGGVNIGTGTRVAIGNTANPLRLGMNNDNEPFSGRIADVAIWADTLTPTEFAQLAAGAHPLTLHPSNIRGYWPICGIGNPEPDVINGNQATIVGTLAAADHAGGNSPCNTGTSTGLRPVGTGAPW